MQGAHAPKSENREHDNITNQIIGINSLWQRYNHMAYHFM